MVTLYQKDTGGRVKVWTIDVKKYRDYSEITIQSGKLGGKLVQNITKVTQGKNIGRSNETDHFTQAVSEMESTILNQLRKGYVSDLDKVQSSAVLGSGIPAPMLAQKYSKDGSQHGSKTLDQLKIRGKKIIVQPKLDGNRCLIRVINGKAVMYTRKGDVMGVQLEHIINDILENDYHPQEEVILDGELFSTEISFNTLNGLIKRVNATPEEIEKRKLIKFNLYDVMLNTGYENRLRKIQHYASDNILVVPSHLINAEDDYIQTWLETFLLEGHEGLMIRQLGIPYENKRTWQLCKVKVFEDAEFQLIGFEEDVRGGFVGAFVMRDGSDGKVWNAGASGQSVEERTEMWNNQEKYLGKMATVEYFGFSEYSVPRFPKFKGIRE